ncbi:hypothetical protein GmHk_02G003666 [Glycine max]|nr:hypothetical protein GmHk_02G003666 [Glycine max]
MFGTSCYLGLLRLYPSSFNSLPLSCKQIDSLPFVLHCSAVISVFVKNQLHEVNLRLETLVEEREYEVAVLHREVSDPATGLENKASALAEEQRRDIAELKTKKDLTVKSSQESLTVIVIETLIKEAIEVVSSEKSEIQSRNRALEKKIGSLETELK